jgi:hypothetical protein
MHKNAFALICITLISLISIDIDKHAGAVDIPFTNTGNCTAATPCLIHSRADQLVDIVRVCRTNLAGAHLMSFLGYEQTAASGVTPISVADTRRIGCAFISASKVYVAMDPQITGTIIIQAFDHDNSGTPTGRFGDYRNIDFAQGGFSSQVQTIADTQYPRDHRICAGGSNSVKINYERNGSTETLTIDGISMPAGNGVVHANCVRVNSNHIEIVRVNATGQGTPGVVVRAGDCLVNNITCGR